MPAPKEIIDLVARFEEHVDAYRGGNYKETQLRREFLDPFFKALGWDVDNSQGYAEAYKEVVHEDAVKIGNFTKAPDYSFRVGGARKFFVEAKKPSVYIKGEPEPAFQLRRYAWSAKLPLSLLTDFEEFALYDCRVRPNKDDKADKGRTLYITYREYPERWDEIAAIFSKEAVLKGSFDKYATTAKGKRGTAEVDDAFLDEIESWRELLAKNIALRNAELSQKAVNYAVQQTIDRVIFLRICEDRGIERYGKLQALANGSNVYARLVEMFQQADARYNSGLFHFNKEKDRVEEPDRLTPKLVIDDKPLKEIFQHLYYPDSPYEFSVLGADILGSVYERFLGKVIRLTAGHQAKIEDKPEVKKAGGVFYTPTYIVDYIVKHTVGRLVEGKTPTQLSKLRVLDPACGSGSFLIGAYQFLLDWHLKWYIDDGTEKHAKGKQPKIYQGKGGVWRLTTNERKRILTNNIYGVDIDAQAVEVTKLSLLLKVLEGESDQTLQTQLFQERVLPDLGHNIKCGNSLIGPDFYETVQLNLLDDTERERINVFDWNKEFADIMRDGGFDAVIGNPPYIRIQVMKEWAPQEVEYYKERYVSASKGNYDIYVVFIEKGVDLLSNSGMLGFILPHKFFNAEYGGPLRELLSKGKHLNDIVHFGHQQVFSGATTYTCLLFLSKKAKERFGVARVAELGSWRVGERSESSEIDSCVVSGDPWNFGFGDAAALRQRLVTTGVKLGECAHIFVGLQTSADKIYVLEHLKDLRGSKVYARDTEGGEWELEREALKPFLNKVSLSRYGSPQHKHWLIFPYNVQGGRASIISASEMSIRFPNTWHYLKKNQDALKKRGGAEDLGANWHGYVYRKNLTAFEESKLVVQVISQNGRYAFDKSGVYFTGGGNGPYYGVRWNSPDDPHSIHYLQGLLNSRLLDFLLHAISTPFRGGYWSYGKRFIEQLPIRLIDFGKPDELARHSSMVSLVESMLILNHQLSGIGSPHEQQNLKRQIDAMDRQIDKLVYELYGLTDEEIKVVEGEQ